jgi:hypothetical protein
MHKAWCEDCANYTESGTLGKAFSDADWHNTLTGHTVRVTEQTAEDALESWFLTDEGWDSA